MPIYSYRNEHGDEYEHFARMADDKPEEIEVKDHESLPDGIYRRDFGAVQVNGMEHARYPYASVRMAGVISEKDAEHKDCTIRGIPRKNIPIVRDAAHERSLMSKYGLARE